MDWLTAVNTRLSRWAMYVAAASLLGLVAVVISSVFWRYVLNDAPSWSEQIALLLVITVSMFGASAGVRDAGHIGMDVVVLMTPESWRKYFAISVHCINLCFGGLLFAGCLMMAFEVRESHIPTLGISESFRYLPPIIGGMCIVLFSIEHLIAMYTHKKVIPSWH